MRTVSGFLISRAILSLCSSLCSEMGRQWVQCGGTGLAPEPLQNIPLRDRWLAGWLVAGKQAQQQTTTPALHNSYRERKKNPFWKGINTCYIIPVISDKSATICKYIKKKKKKRSAFKSLIILSVEGRAAESITAFGIILQG